MFFVPILLGQNMGTKNIFTSLHVEQWSFYSVHTCTCTTKTWFTCTSTQKGYPSEKKLRDTTHMDEKSEKIELRTCVHVNLLKEITA